jgi:hypothetical protein
MTLSFVNSSHALLIKIIAVGLFALVSGCASVSNWSTSNTNEVQDSAGPASASGGH